MKKILFIVNGLGLGNSTRCESIIKVLISRGLSVDIITSGNGKNYYKNQNYFSNLYEFKSFYYAKNKNGELSIWYTFLYIPKFILFFFHNARLLKNLIKSNSYSGVVIDSDYTIFWLKNWIKIPIFALNNACNVVKECKKLPEIPKKIQMQYLIEKCDNLYHRKIPDLVLVPTLNIKSIVKKKSFKYLPPFIRLGLNVRLPEINLKQILIMFSGSQFKGSVEFLKELKIRNDVKIDVLGQNGESNNNITFHGKIYNNKDFINKADIMVVNGGFSAISEAVVLRKPVVIIPIQKHAEQYINAINVEKERLGLIANENNIVEKIHEMIERFPEFVKNHQLFGCAKNGSELAADIIIKKIG